MPAKKTKFQQISYKIRLLTTLHADKIRTRDGNLELTIDKCIKTLKLADVISVRQRESASSKLGKTYEVMVYEYAHSGWMSAKTISEPDAYGFVTVVTAADDLIRINKSALNALI